MAVGAAALLNIFGAVFQFIADVFFTVAEFAYPLGNPELSLGCALAVVALAASGHYTLAVGALLVLTLLDLVLKEILGFNLSGCLL